MNLQINKMQERWIAMTIALALILAFFLLMGCSEKASDQTGQSAATNSMPVSGHQPAQKSGLEGDNEILAVVNGSNITRYDVGLIIRKLFGQGAAHQLDGAARRKVLESIVAGRAISQVAQKELSPMDRAGIDKKVAAYREELLVQQYLLKHAQPQPVTDNMIRRYYEAHPEKFGGKTVRTFELITAGRQITAKERDILLSVLKNPAAHKDWKDWVTRLKKTGSPVVYRKGEVSADILDKRLVELIKPLSKGESSQVTFIDGMPYVIRVLAEKQIAPQPLSEVSAKIRQTLAPIQIRKAVQLASEQVLKSAKVVYK